MNGPLTISKMPYNGQVCIQSPRGLVAVMESGNKDTRERDAAYIVRACNCFDELLDALQAIVAKFESDPDDLETMDAGIAIAKEAITKAGAVLNSEELAQCRSMNNPPQDEGDQ